MALTCIRQATLYWQAGGLLSLVLTMSGGGLSTALRCAVVAAVDVCHAIQALITLLVFAD